MTKKPLRTAGEKLAADLSDAWGTSDFPDNPSALQSLAINRGYTDDPDPPSDGELLKIAIRRSFGGALWTDEATEDVAIEFRRLLAERDGVAT